MEFNSFVGIVGSRNYNDYDAFEKIILSWMEKNGPIDSIISGGASGVDSLAERFAKKHKIEIMVYSPDWKRGEEAPKMRNTLIVEASQRILAFPTKDSRGTWDSVNKAKKKGIPVEIFKV